MSKDLLSLLSGSGAWRSLLVSLKKNGVYAAYNLAEGQRAFLAAALAAHTGRPVLLVTQTAQQAARAAEDCSQLLSGGAFALPAPEMQFARAAASRELLWRQMETLERAAAGEARVLCAPVEALLTRYMPPARYRAGVIALRVGERIAPAALIARLVQNGYERMDMVEGKGQCALRGAIVDVYPPAQQNALRIEFFDDEIDSIRAFDCISQRSLSHLQAARLSPAAAWLLSAEECAAASREMLALLGEDTPGESPLSPALPPLPEEPDDAREELLPAARDAFSPRARLREDALALAGGMPFRNFGMWAPLFTAHAPLCAWLDNPIVLLDAPDQLQARCEERALAFAQELAAALERGEAVSAQSALLSSYDECLSSLSGLPVVTLSDFLRGMGRLKPAALFDFNSVGAAAYHARLRELAGEVRALLDQGTRVALLAGGAARGQRLAQSLQELGAPVTFCETPRAPREGEALVLPLAFSHGFLMPDAKAALFAGGDIYGALMRKSRARRHAGERIEAFTDLKEGDYVVHESHGVGIFRGAVRLQSEGTYRDYLYIQYAGNDKLYVPVDQFDRVQKFIGAQETPPLNSLSGGEWQRQKNKVKAGLKKLAFDLVALYADRQALPGHAFAPDTPWQRQFEDNFPYEPTPDQLQAMRDITHDMEAPHNMDRLLCGDVGYGKTEVALRAAFKAVMDGKQVALLAPTTILAQQHYYTMRQRFEGFPVSVDVISRFRSAKEQKEVLARLAQGKIDILAGTHRMLAKDVVWKDLGLLIVDEEQRFGVAHKEIIKNLKRRIDVLTLSATPIPRTLHMSMVGIRDMSLLETPPEERFPVQTYVIEYNDGIVRDAILREIGRGGQVYFLYNRVGSIEAFYARLRALVPEARIAVAHGQMREHALEDVMMDFSKGEYDVLLSTTIIENGLDIPKANTLIVFDADRFGLSQLYQLRGRVGRSNRLAYAYFTVRPDRMLSETAQKRLQAIREFTEFGSGFRIAMRDLEIRGAGNLLGPEQSGKVSAVGYDMYCKLLEEALRDARGQAGQPLPAAVETRVELRVDAFLPAEYVRGERARMEMYKRISLIQSREDREDILEELIDRFGDVPKSVENLVDIAHLRALCARLGVARVTHAGGVMTFMFDKQSPPDSAALYAALQHADKRFVLSAGKIPALLLRDARLSPEQMLSAAVPAVENLERAMTAAP